MSARDDILARVRRNQPGSQPLPEVPRFDPPRASLTELFKTNLGRMGGVFVEECADLHGFIRRAYPAARVIASAAHEIKGNRDLGSVRQPAELDDVDVGVVRAGFGVAETGSVFLTQVHFKVNALGFLSQHLVVLLDLKDIVPTLHDAYRHAGFRQVSYAVLLSGPSATADIEGVLVRGAQGIRSLAVVAAPV
jgi:L-lactate dehydrogenase complex protein LldG